jgi:dipeptidyl aminopeptidase/acylaminoacyl peptidase
MSASSRALAAALALSLVAGAAAAASERLVHRFLEIALSPDGSRVAAIEGNAPRHGEMGHRDLVIRRSDGSGAATVTVPCGRAFDCRPSSPAWSKDGRALAFVLRVPGSHARAVYTVDRDGQHLTRLLAFDGTVTGLRYGPAGRLALLATTSARKEIGATQAGVPLTGELGAGGGTQRLATLDRGGRLAWASPPGLCVYEYDWLPDGGFVATAAPGDCDNNWWAAQLYALDRGAAPRVIYTTPDRRHQIALPSVSPDGRKVAFVSGLMSDFGVVGGDVYTLALDGGTAADVTPGLAASALALAWRCDGTLLATLLAGADTELAEVGDGGAPRIVWRGTETLSATDAGLSLACSSSATAAVHESWTAPPEIEVGPIGAWRDLTRVNADLTMPLEARSLTWQSGGVAVQGWLLLPKAAPRAGKYPLIVGVHGGPASAWQPRFAGPGLTSILLARGIALFRPNPRGSFGQGEAFTAANVRDLGHGDLADILAGIDAAIAAAPIDPGQLGIMGGSYGGYMAMWAVTQTRRFKLAIASHGISDWLSYYGENGIDQWMIPYFGASVYDDPEIYARSSPINFIRNVRTPTLAIAGERDIECPPAQTQEFWHALRTLGVPAEAVIYPGEGHAVRDPAHSADMERRMLAWIERYLK